MVVLCLSVLIALLDQVTKHLIHTRYLAGDGISVIQGFFDLKYVQNTGAAWGMLAGLNDWLVVISLIILAAMILFRRSIMVDVPLHRIAMGCMVAGIMGNLIDRVRLGYVVDFLDFYAGPHHFPAFNVADSAICTGVGLYIISQFLADRRARAQGVSSAAPAADASRREGPQP
jgi:signal peptidase II